MKQLSMSQRTIEEVLQWSQHNLAYIDWEIFNPQTQLLLAVSGGKDSSFLLHLAMVWYRKGLLKTIPHIFHMDHQLRKSSQRDAQFVESLALKYKTPLSSCTISVQKFAQKSQMNLEEAGRHLRYRRLFRQAIRLQKTQRKISTNHLPPVLICTGHHANDYMESALMHLIRGGGKQIWTTMPLLSRIAPAIALFRPLLGINVSEIINRVQQWAVPFRLDESNADVRFLRNRIRQSVLPMLEGEGLQANLIWKNMHSRHSVHGNDADVAVLHEQESAAKNEKPEHLWVDRHCFDSPTSVKMQLDLICSTLRLYPLGHKTVQEIVKVWFGKNPLTSGQTLNFHNRTLLIWANQSSPIFFFKRKARCLKIPKVQLETDNLTSKQSFPQDQGWEKKRKHSISYNGKTLCVLLSENQSISTLRPGFFMKTKMGRKKIKKIFQERALPRPIRRVLPLIVKNDSREVEKIFWEFWSQSKS